MVIFITISETENFFTDIDIKIKYNCDFILHFIHLSFLFYCIGRTMKMAKSLSKFLITLCKNFATAKFSFVIIMYIKLSYNIFAISLLRNMTTDLT